MRLSWRDGVTTALAAGVLALYAAVTAGGWLPAAGGTRAAGAIVFLAGLAMCVVGAGEPDRAATPRWVTYAAGALALTALVSAVVAVVAASGTALAVLVWSIVALWLFATVRHAVVRPARGPVEPPRAEVLLERHRDALPPRVEIR